ncbi:MAG TPA: hypothetical protein VEI27_02010 [Dehalococcoidales bacterium]|nr:hypothetical protein [Dehalococcoidales bacterium]
MNRDDIVIDSEQRWAIDLNWLEANNRSLTTLAKASVCAKCRKKLKLDHGEVKSSEILKSVKTCCSKSPDFITGTLPLQESTFRVFLANGNEALTLDELGKQLSDRRGVDAYRTSPSILSRLLASDQHYGLRRV